MKKLPKILISIVVLTGLGISLSFAKDNLSKIKEKKDCIPYNFLIEKENKAIKVVWESDNGCIMILKFGSDLEAMDSWLNATENSGTYSVVINTEDYGHVRYMGVVSNGKLYGTEGRVIKLD